MFSKFLYAVPIQNKDAVTVSEVLNSLLLMGVENVYCQIEVQSLLPMSHLSYIGYCKFHSNSLPVLLIIVLEQLSADMQL